jgi:hypothetical protein
MLKEGALAAGQSSAMLGITGDSRKREGAPAASRAVLSARGARLRDPLTHLAHLKEELRLQVGNVAT